MKIIELERRPERLFYGTVEHPVAGTCTVAWCEAGLCALHTTTGKAAQDELRRVWGAELVERKPDFDPFAEDVTLLIYGTPLHRKVWRALLEIPDGTTLTYSELAARVGRPAAVRAVASAVARNELGIIIPCHLILPKSGGVGNYRWGAEIKERLIKN